MEVTYKLNPADSMKLLETKADLWVLMDEAKRAMTALRDNLNAMADIMAKAANEAEGLYNSQPEDWREGTPEGDTLGTLWNDLQDVATRIRDNESVDTLTLEDAKGAFVDIIQIDLSSFITV